MTPGFLPVPESGSAKEGDDFGFGVGVDEGEAEVLMVFVRELGLLFKYPFGCAQQHVQVCV